MADVGALPSLVIPQDELDAIQLGRLTRYLHILADGHPHYGAMLRDVDFERWEHVSDLDAVPITTKGDLAADPDRFRLRDVDGRPFESWDVVYTSGTTGSPVPIHQTPHDHRRILFSQRRMAEIRGTSSSDTIANLFPIAARPNGSWLRVNDHAAAIGATLVVGLGGPDSGPYSPTRRLDDVISVVADADPTVLWGVGSYLRRFVARCAELGRRLPSVRMVIASGEALGPSTVSHLLDGLRSLGVDDPVVSPGFGASELQCSLVPCEQGAGFHNPAPELFLLQTVDETGRTRPPGVRGRLVVTHLDRTGTSLVRYALGDDVTLERGRCPACGRSGERLVAHHGRGDTMVKIRGQLVDLHVVESLLARDSEVAGYSIDVVGPDRADDPKAMDELRILVAAEPGTRHDDVRRRVSATVLEAVSVRPDIVPVDREDLYPIDEVMKPTRIRRNP